VFNRHTAPLCDDRITAVQSAEHGGLSLSCSSASIAVAADVAGFVPQALFKNIKLKIHKKAIHTEYLVRNSKMMVAHSNITLFISFEILIPDNREL
jgi:hypothetical protein